jgi:ABC-type tungstate transport system permease subunit
MDFKCFTVIIILLALPNVAKAYDIELRLATTASGIDGEENRPGNATA